MNAKALLDAIVLDGNGLVPAIAQQYDSGEVLMLAWMNREAIKATVSTGQAHYWSRRRAKLWRKGETSGQTQRIVDVRIDCDGDTLLLLVDQTGVACHTGRRQCFFRRTGETAIETFAPVEIDPKSLYGNSGNDAGDG